MSVFTPLGKMAMAMGIALVIVIYMTDGNIDSVVIFSIFISAPPTIATDCSM